MENMLNRSQLKKSYLPFNYYFRRNLHSPIFRFQPGGLHILSPVPGMEHYPGSEHVHSRRQCYSLYDLL